MRHPTAMILSALIVAVNLWAGAAALTPYAGLWSPRHGMMGPGSLLAGPGIWGAMHGWGRGPYI